VCVIRFLVVGEQGNQQAVMKHYTMPLSVCVVSVTRCVVNPILPCISTPLNPLVHLTEGFLLWFVIHTERKGPNIENPHEPRRLAG